MAFWCYLLRCADGRFYTGHTDDLEWRIGEHQAGGYCDFTARRRPVALVWAEAFPTRLEALEAERQIKGWSRAKKEALIAGDWARVSQLAVSYAARASTGSARTEEEAIAATPVRPELVEGRVQSATLNHGNPPLPVRPEPVEGRAKHTTEPPCP